MHAIHSRCAKTTLQFIFVLVQIMLALCALQRYNTCTAQQNAQQFLVKQTHTMQKLTAQNAQNAIVAHANNNVVTAQQVAALLNNASVTFAQITYVTKVQTAAAHKAQNIVKVTTANVILCANVKAHTSVYANKVRKTATAIAANNAANVQAFVAQQNYFTHTATHCIVAHTQHPNKQYLYAIYNNASSVYMHNNVVVNKQHVAQFLTASAAAQLLQNSNIVHNKTHNVLHTVQVRTIALSNIVSIKARKQLLTVA